MKVGRQKIEAFIKTPETCNDYDKYYGHKGYDYYLEHGIEEYNFFKNYFDEAFADEPTDLDLMKYFLFDLTETDEKIIRSMPGLIYCFCTSETYHQ